jgi:hypothetical protein
MSETVHLDGSDFEIIVVQEDGGGDYQWGQAALLRRIADGQLVLVHDGGCSCNSPWEDPDLTPVASWQDAVERVKAEPPYLFNEDDIAAFAQKLMALRPTPSQR